MAGLPLGAALENVGLGVGKQSLLELGVGRAAELQDGEQRGP